MSFLININNKNEIENIYCSDASSNHILVPAFSPLTSRVQDFIKDYFFNDSPSSRIITIYLGDLENKEIIICKSHLEVLCSDTDVQPEIIAGYKHYEIPNKELYSIIERNIILAHRFEQLKSDTQQTWMLMRSYLEKIKQPFPNNSHFSLILNPQLQQLNMQVYLAKPLIEIDPNWLLSIEDLPHDWNILSNEEKVEYICSLTNTDVLQASFLIQMLSNPQKWLYARTGALAHEMAHYIGHSITHYMSRNPSLRQTYGPDTLKQLSEISADLVAAELGPHFREGLIHFLRSLDAASPSVDLGIENLGKDHNSHPPYALRARLLATSASCIFNPEKP